MFGRRQATSAAPSSRAGPSYGAASSGRKNSIHVNAMAPPQLAEKKRSVSIHSMPLSPRKPALHRSASIDLTVLSEDSTHAHHILQTLEETDYLEQVRRGDAVVTFRRIHLPGHELGFYAIVGPTQLLLWNSHPLHRAVAGKESPALHLQPIYTLPYPPEMTPLDIDGSHVILTASSFHSTTKICALVLARDGRVCFWEDINGSSIAAVTRLSMDDSEYLCHAGPSLPLVVATSTQTLWEIKLDDDRSSLRVSKLRSRRQGLWGQVSRFLSSATPSPILLTKALGTSELLVLHVDSNLERRALSPDGFESLWTFQLCGFMMDYFAQHEDGVLVYAQCLDMPLATLTHFSLLVGFQTGTDVVLYLFEFMATLTEMPQYLRSIRLGTVPTIESVQCVPINDQSVYVVSSTTLFAISVPAFPDMPLHSHAIALPYPLTTGVGVLHQSLLYLHPTPWSLRQFRSLQWTLTPAESLAPEAKRYKPTLDLHQHRSLAEWKALLTDQFQQFSSASITFHVDDTMSHGLSQAVVELAQEILDAKPSTGLHWDGSTSSWAPQLIKYQLQDKATRHRHWLRFLTTTGLFPALAEKAQQQLQEFEEKLVAAAALLHADDVRSDALLHAMHAVLVEDRGYTTEQMDATGFSVLDLFYGDVSQVDQLALHLTDDGCGALLVTMLQAVETWRRGQDTFHSPADEPWTAQGAIRTSCRRILQGSAPRDEDRALLSLVVPMVRFMDTDEKDSWTRCVLVPLVASATHDDTDVVDLIYAFEFLEGMAALSPPDRLHRYMEAHPVTATFFFEWYAGLVPNPWTSTPEVDLQSLLHPPRSLLPALYEFLKSHATLAKYAWLVSVELEQYNQVAQCALHDARRETESLERQKTMLSLGKLAAYAADESSPNTAVFDQELLRVRVQEALEVSRPLPPANVLQACLDELTNAASDPDRTLHWLRLAMDVVASVDMNVEAMKRQLWRDALLADSDLWIQVLDEYTACTNETQLEAAMKKSLIYRSLQEKPEAPAALTTDVIDALVEELGETSPVINAKTRPLLVKTLALAGLV
ncbi:Aste57867_24186 [Aphanomyces stellatus]|uniref:Aste57867_24186 protein n=1 Tax=Aphanomyces stellatus TaxID=120398 RepID=A0A485LPS3_9STRA|nr:hypothetical protein As57867_024112 [Aphanomyces stellatus]VFU00828.1 Aste57867_24186 [Aphanomyces stellatus]